MKDQTKIEAVAQMIRIDRRLSIVADLLEDNHNEQDETLLRIREGVLRAELDGEGGGV